MFYSKHELRFTFYSILICITIFSCGPSEAEKLAKLRITENKEAKDQAIRNLKNQYKIQYSWDTLSFEHSIDYQKIIDSKIQVIQNFEILDIFKQNDDINIKLKVGFGDDLYVILNCNQNQIDAIKNDKNKSFFNSNTILVVSVNEIKKMNFQVSTENYDEEYPSIELDEEAGFIAKGKLIEVIKI